MITRQNKTVVFIPGLEKNMNGILTPLAPNMVRNSGQTCWQKELVPVLIA